MPEELSSSYSAAITALRAMRTVLERELSDFLRSARSGDLPTDYEFREKKVYFEGLCDDVVKMYHSLVLPTYVPSETSDQCEP